MGQVRASLSVLLVHLSYLPAGGSFRHFLWQVVRELQSPVLPLLAPCPSSAAGINKGKHILAPRPMTYSEEKLLEFLGQVLITITTITTITLLTSILPSAVAGCGYESRCAHGTRSSTLFLEESPRRATITQRPTRGRLSDLYLHSATTRGELVAAMSGCCVTSTSYTG